MCVTLPVLAVVVVVITSNSFVFLAHYTATNYYLPSKIYTFIINIITIPIATWYTYYSAKIYMKPTGALILSLYLLPSSLCSFPLFLSLFPFQSVLCKRWINWNFYRFCCLLSISTTRCSPSSTENTGQLFAFETKQENCFKPFNLCLHIKWNIGLCEDSQRERKPVARFFAIGAVTELMVACLENVPM